MVNKPAFWVDTLPSHDRVALADLGEVLRGEAGTSKPKAILARMTGYRTRVIQVVFESEPDLSHPWKRQTRIVAVILYPLELKRRLATLDNAKARAVELAHQIIERDCFRPPVLEALTCSVKATLYDLRPLQRPHWILEDGTKVWLAEAQRDPDCPSRPVQWGAGDPL